MGKRSIVSRFVLTRKDVFPHDCPCKWYNEGTVRRRFAIAALFAIMGTVCAGCAAAIPEIKAVLDLDDAGLGLLLVSGPVGTALSYLVGGWYVSRFGSRTGALTAVAGYVLSVFGFGLCFLLRPPLPFWIAAIGLMPAFGNVLNICANTQGGLYERRSGTRAMSFFHGNWSLGNLGCSLVLLGFAAVGVGIGPCLLAIAVVSGSLAALAVRGLDPDELAKDGKDVRKIWRFPTLPLLLLGLVALLFAGCEGAVMDWAGVFYKDVLQAPRGCVMVGYCAVMMMITVGRFVTDRIVSWSSPTFVVRAYSLLVALGLASVATLSVALPAGIVRLVSVTLAYAVVGLGLSGLSPLVYSSAARTAGVKPSSSITIVSSIGFLAYFLSPPLIGSLSIHWGLPAALGAYAAFMLLGTFVRMK